MSFLDNLFRGREPAKKPAAKPTPKPSAKAAPAPPPAAEPAPAPPVTAEPAAPAAPDLDAIRAQLREIEEIIGAEEEAAVTEIAEDVTALEIPLRDVLEVLPTNYVRRGASEVDVRHRVTVTVPALFDQLARGRVTTTIGRVIAEVPENHLASDIHQHEEEEIVLPLPLVVAAVRPEELEKRKPAAERHLAATDIPNLFTREGEKVATAEAAPPPVPTPAPLEVPPAAEEAVAEEIAEVPTAEEVSREAPPVPVPAVEAVAEEAGVTEEEAVEEAAAEAAGVTVEEEARAYAAAVREEAPVEERREELPVEEEVPTEQEVAAEAWAEEAVPVEEAAAPQVEEAEAAAPRAVAEAPPAVSPAYEEVVEGAYLFLRGLDLNKATAEEMVERLDGVGPKLAQRIVEDREKNGPFFYLMDLARVPGLGRKTFERLTGLPLRKQIFEYLGIVGQVLGRSLDGVPDVRQVAARFKELEGFEGCVLAHEDGYLLAASWDPAKSEAFGAFAPQMYKKMGQYLRRLDLGGVGSITFFLEDRPFTLVRSGEVFLIAVHAPSRFSRKQVHIVQAIGAELGRRLMRRRVFETPAPEA